MRVLEIFLAISILIFPILFINGCGKNNSLAPLNHTSTAAPTTSNNSSGNGSNTPSGRGTHPNGTNGNTSPVPHETPPATTSNWTFQFISKCPTLSSEKCVGSYGFTLKSNGTYQIGPGPNGETLTGPITADELKNLTSLLISLPSKEALEDVKGKENCVPAPQLETTDLIQFNLSDKEIGKIHSSKAELCYTSFSQTIAVQLEGLIHGLAIKYYPEIFPNPCIDATIDLNRFYDSLRFCITDRDCAYIGNDYLPLSSLANAKFITNDCSYIKPILVANSFSAVVNQLKLLTIREIALQLCGTQIVPYICSPNRIIDFCGRPPLCLQGRCQINPAVNILP